MVLLIEEAASNVRPLLRTRLLTAHTGTEAIRLAVDRHPSVIMVPERLAGGPAMGTVKALRAVAPRSMVFVLAQEGSRSQADGYFKAGAAAYIDRRHMSWIPALVAMAESNGRACRAGASVSVARRRRDSRRTLRRAPLQA